MRTNMNQNTRKKHMSISDQIFLAIKENNISEIEELFVLTTHISLDSVDNNGNTFLTLAAMSGNADCV